MNKNDELAARLHFVLTPEGMLGVGIEGDDHAPGVTVLKWCPRHMLRDVKLKSTDVALKVGDGVFELNEHPQYRQPPETAD